MTTWFPYGAADVEVVADGATDQAAALQRLCDSLPTSASVHLPRRGTPYAVRGTVTPRAGQRFVSDGAVIDSTGFDGVVFDVTVDDVSFEGLSFVGPNTGSGYSRAIRTAGTRTRVERCAFRYFWGGAVILNGTDGAVTGCTFREVQNKANVGEGDYGGVHLGSTATRNLVADNRFSEFSYSAVSLYGATRNVVRGNIMTAAAGFPAASMGVYALAGASRNLIEGNSISDVGNEAIVLVDPAATMSHNIISGNYLQDSGYAAGISLEGPGVQYTQVKGNTIAVVAATGIDHGIWLDAGDYNTIEGNILTGAGQILAGIRLSNTPTDNAILDNHVTGCTTGIIGAGLRLLCRGNRVRDCPTGINFSFAQQGVIAENVVSGSTTNSIVSGSDVDSAVVRNNQIDRKAAVTCERHGNRIGTAVYEGTVTLVAGAATITAWALNSGFSDGVLQLSHETAGGTPGALYVLSRNSAGGPGTAEIRSTSPTDTSVVRWRVVR